MSDTVVDQGWPNAMHLPLEGDAAGVHLHTEHLIVASMAGDDLPGSVILAVRPEGCDIGVYIAMTAETAREIAGRLTDHATALDRGTLQ
jgi:hypothetical protein